MPKRVANAEEKLDYVLFHGSIKVGPPEIRPDGTDFDGYLRAPAPIELTEAMAKSMDPKGDMLMLREDFEKLQEIAVKNAELEHQRKKRSSKEKKPTQLSRKVDTALKMLTDKVLADLAKADADKEADDEEEKKPE